jgi:predicted acetyltransferase
MEISIERVPADQAQVLRNLMELYQHDHAEFEDAELDDNGLYGYKFMDHYWTEPGRHPFLIGAEGRIAGFALVRDSTNTGDGRNHLAEFFIVRKYRRRGIGRTAAHRIFDMFPGAWSVGQVERNLPAKAFWRSIISDYTDGRFEETTDPNWGKGPVRVFESRARP